MELDYYCTPAKCSRTAGEYFIQWYKAYDGTWVLTRAQKEAPKCSGDQRGSKVLLSPARYGPQYACPYCGGRRTYTCCSCGTEICDTAEKPEGYTTTCPKCNSELFFSSKNKANESAASSGSGQ